MIKHIRPRSAANASWGLSFDSDGYVVLGTESLRGRRLLVLDYAIEPEGFDDMNYSYRDNPKDGIWYIQTVLGRVISGTRDNSFNNVDYYKITALDGDFIPEETIKSIIDSTEPDYLLVIGDDLFYRMPLIDDDGPVLESRSGAYAETMTLSVLRPSGSPVICLPMPHPRTPGFDEEEEKEWHEIIVELFKL